MNDISKLFNDAYRGIDAIIELTEKHNVSGPNSRFHVQDWVYNFRTVKINASMAVLIASYISSRVRPQDIVIAPNNIHESLANADQVILARDLADPSLRSVLLKDRDYQRIYIAHSNVVMEQVEEDFLYAALSKTYDNTFIHLSG